MRAIMECFWLLKAFQYRGTNLLASATWCWRAFLAHRASGGVIEESGVGILKTFEFTALDFLFYKVFNGLSKIELVSGENSEGITL